MITRLSRCLATAFLLASTLTADEIRLRDGTVLIGRVRSQGQLVHVTTEDETWTLRRDQVLRIRSEAELETQLRRLRHKADDTPHAWVEIARLGRKWRLHHSMWKDLQRCLQLCPGGTPERARLDQLLATLEPALLPSHRLNDSAAGRIHQLLRQIRPGNSSAKQAAVEAVLVAMQGPEVDAELQQQVERSASASRRGLVLQVISKRDRPGAQEFVWEQVVVDPSAALRRDLARSVAACQDRRQAIDFLATALNSDLSAAHIRAAEAFAEIGDPAAIQHLIAAGKNLTTGKRLDRNDTSRGHLAITRQQAYVSDFETAVAQNVAIAKPVVRSAQSGVVLDVALRAVIVERRRVIGVYRRTLQQLGGSDPGSDPKRWDDWDARRRAGLRQPTR